MKIRLKNIRDQVIVITGASSGIALVTARMAAHEGARVVLASRDEPALRRLADELRDNATDALPVPTDVTGGKRSSAWPMPPATGSADPTPGSTMPESPSTAGFSRFR